jgi:hypothetical protein
VEGAASTATLSRMGPAGGGGGGGTACGRCDMCRADGIRSDRLDSQADRHAFSCQWAGEAAARERHARVHTHTRSTDTGMQ